jgi:hypothetical protein
MVKWIIAYILFITGLTLLDVFYGNDWYTIPIFGVGLFIVSLLMTYLVSLADELVDGY